MADFTEVLRLERDAVLAVALSHIGYAVAQQREVRERVERQEHRDKLAARADAEHAAELDDLRMVAASALMIGASLYALVFQRVARALFRAAAAAYEELRMPYAAVLVVCGGDNGDFERHWAGAIAHVDAFESEPDGVTAVLVLAARRAAAGGDNPDRVLDAWPRLMAAPPGGLGIPATTYGNLADELHSLARIRRPPNAPRVLRLFEAFEERVEAAQTNVEQWQVLHTSLLPVEPEVLASAVAVVASSARWATDLGALIESRGLSPVARVPLEIAIEMERPMTDQERSAVRDSEALGFVWQNFSRMEDRP